MRGLRLFERPVAVDAEELPLHITGELAGYSPGQEYEGRLQYHNSVGRCRVEITDSHLPPGHYAYVDNLNKEIVLRWPAYSPPTPTESEIQNPAFQQGLEGWVDLRGSSWSVRKYEDDDTSVGPGDRPRPPGNLAAWMTGVGRGDHILESVPYPVAPGQYITARALWDQGPSNKDNNNLFTALGLYRDGQYIDTVYGDRIHDRTNRTRHWSSVDLLVSPGVNEVTVRLVAHRRNGRNREIIVDNVETTGLVYEAGTEESEDDYFVCFRLTDSAAREATWCGPIPLGGNYASVNRKGHVIDWAGTLEDTEITLVPEETWDAEDYVLIGINTRHTDIIESPPGFSLLVNESASGSLSQQTQLRVYGGLRGDAPEWVFVTSQGGVYAAAAIVLDGVEGPAEIAPSVVSGNYGASQDVIPPNQYIGNDRGMAGVMFTATNPRPVTDLRYFHPYQRLPQNYVWTGISNQVRSLYYTPYVASEDSGWIRPPSLIRLSTTARAAAGGVLLRRKTLDGPLPSPLYSVLEDYLSDKVGYAWVASKNGTVLESGYGGYMVRPEDSGETLPYDLNTSAPWASVGKIITEVAVRLLAQQGALSLEDTLGAHLGTLPMGPGVPDIRIRDLLSMRSGKRQTYSLSGTYPATVHTWLTSSASYIGESYHYQNGDFAALMLVIEQVTGDSYVDWVRDNVLSPIGLGSLQSSINPEIHRLYNAGGSASVPAFDVPATAVGGWVGSTFELSILAAALRRPYPWGGTLVQDMLDDRYRLESAFTPRGGAHYHDGDLTWTGSYSCASFLFRGPDGVDVVLTHNTEGGHPLSPVCDMFDY